MALKLILGNKNYSSWSLRPWLAFRQFDIAFEEEVVPFDFETGNEHLLDYSPAGRVPVLMDDGFCVWDSMAILEYAADLHPEKMMWPRARQPRAHGRAICAEMHAGFSALRHALPMNIRRKQGAVPLDDATRGDIARIEDIWSGARRSFGANGPFLFGGFSIADAVYAPVVTRFDTYAVEVAPDTRAYMDAVLGLPAFAEWKAASEAEPWVVKEDEK